VVPINYNIERRLCSDVAGALTALTAALDSSSTHAPDATSPSALITRVTLGGGSASLDNAALITALAALAPLELVLETGAQPLQLPPHHAVQSSAIETLVVLGDKGHVTASKGDVQPALTAADGTESPGQGLGAWLPNLQKLYIAKVTLASLDGMGIERCTKLIHLSCTHGELPAIPTALLAALPELQLLDLTHNSITTITDPLPLPKVHAAAFLLCLGPSNTDDPPISSSNHFLT
jgi:Leucine-rich repeat (LRR) protein